MKFSEKWLRSLVDIKANQTQLAEKLTFAGLEVEEIDGDSIELAITPNRGDCLSVSGIAREVGVLYNVDVKSIKPKQIKAKDSHRLKIKVKNTKSCPVYIGRVIKNIDNTAKTPDWIVERLKASDVNVINPVVDITNYVMLELGQPMHGFDLDKIDSEIVVRDSSNETITLLDNKEVKLDKDTLVIADKSKVLAIAGIMGGLDSGCLDTTKNILLESAFFAPDSVRNKVQKYNIHTDSSFRFERGVDFNLQQKAIERATELLLDIVGGEAGKIIIEESSKDLPTIKPIKVRHDRIFKLLGLEVEEKKVTEIFTHLGMKCQFKDKVWTVTPPSYRADVTIEEDLIEEVARVVGYNLIPTTMPNTSLNFHKIREAKVSNMGVKRLLTARGYNEAITYSFIEPELASKFEEEKGLIHLKNPISADMSVMRPSLVPGLLQALAHNQARQEHNVRLFEIGLSFVKKNKGIVQEQMVAGLISGNRFSQNWSVKEESVDFYDIKGDIETIFAKHHISHDISFKPSDKPYLHSGQTATIYKKGEEIGYVGAIHPAMLKNLDIAGPVYVFELKYKSLQESAIPKFKELSKFPSVRRDIAFVVDDNVLVQDITDTILATDSKNITEVLVFDVYKGKGIEPGKKSIAIGMTLQDIDKTLTDNVINSKVDVVVSELEKNFNVTLRK